MWWILDLIIVAIVVIYICISAKRGFVRTVIELVGFFLSIYLAFTLGGIIANSVYDNAVEPAIVEGVAEKINVSAHATVDETVDDVWNSLPEFVVKTAENFDITSNTLRETISENFANNADATTFAKSATETIVKPVLIPLIKAVISLILFVVLLFVIKLLAKIINKVFDLPIIGGINKFLGGIIGLLKGFAVSYIFVIVALLIMSFFEDGFLFFTNENVEESILFDFLANFSPFK